MKPRHLQSHSKKSTQEAAVLLPCQCETHRDTPQVIWGLLCLNFRLVLMEYRMALRTLSTFTQHVTVMSLSDQCANLQGYSPRKFWVILTYFRMSPIDLFLLANAILLKYNLIFLPLLSMAASSTTPTCHK